MSQRNFAKSFPLLFVLSAICSANPVWYRSIDGYSYLIESDLKYNWLQSYDECARRGLQLVDISSRSKNTNLVSILSKNFGPLSLWIGAHDEFNTTVDVKRPFYSIATGQPVAFSNWYNGEPNSKYNATEHCTEIYGGPNGYFWNDKNCETVKLGYICEENIYTAKYRSHMNQKRYIAYQKNIKLSSEFAVTQREVNNIQQNTRTETDNVLNSMQKTSSDNLIVLKKSMEEILVQKQQLELLINNLLKSLNQLILDNEVKLTTVSENIQRNINGINLRAEAAINNATLNHCQKLAANTNEINKLLVF